MYYYFITVAGNDKCVATSDTYSSTTPASGNCLNELDSPERLSVVGQGLVICNNVAGGTPRSATVYSDTAPAVVAVPEGAAPRAAVGAGPKASGTKKAIPKTSGATGDKAAGKAKKGGKSTGK